MTPGACCTAGPHCTPVGIPGAGPEGISGIVVCMGRGHDGTTKKRNLDATTRQRRRPRRRGRARVWVETRGVIAFGVAYTYTPPPARRHVDSHSTSSPLQFNTFDFHPTAIGKRLDKLFVPLSTNPQAPAEIRGPVAKPRKDVPYTLTPLDLIIPKGDTDAFEGPSTPPTAVLISSGPGTPSQTTPDTRSDTLRPTAGEYSPGHFSAAGQRRWGQMLSRVVARVKTRTRPCRRVARWEAATLPLSPGAVKVSTGTEACRWTCSLVSLTKWKV